MLLHFVSLHNYLLLHLKRQLARRDWSTTFDYEFIRDYTLIALHIEFAPKYVYLYKFGKKKEKKKRFIRMGEVETLRGRN